MRGVSPRSGFWLSEVVSLSGGDFYGLDEELLKQLGELMRAAREKDELRHYGRIRKLRSPTAKLIYEFLRSHQFDALIKNASELFKAVKAEKEVIADLASSIVGEKADVVTENTADAIEVNPTVTATEDPLVDNKKKKAGRPKKVVNKLA